MPKNKVKPDTALKAYWRRNAEFADLFNAVLFGGKSVIDAGKLEERDTESSVVLQTDTYVEGLPSARDLFKIAMQTDGVELALLGLENEKAIHYAMPLRDLGYLYKSYEIQYDKIKEKYPNKKGLGNGNEIISCMKKTDKILPVVNVVLYYGDEAWDGPKTLLDMTDVPDWFRPVVQDYRMCLVEVRDTDLVFHNQNNIDLFTLFRLIYDGKKTNVERRAAAEQYGKDHPVDESVMMAIASTSNIDLDLYRKGDVTVCALFDEIEKQGRNEGRNEGREMQARETAKNLYDMGLNIDQIVQAVRYPEEVIEKWLGLLTV